MGVLTIEMEKLNKTIADNQKEVERLTKKLEKSKEEKKTQKEYERDLKLAVENDCMQCMKEDFEKEGFKNACINLQLATTRQDFLNNIAKSEIERNYLDKNYEKIFNKVKKIYENDMKAKEQLQQIIVERQIEEQQKQEEKVKNSTGYKILIGLLIAGAIIFVLIKFLAIIGIALAVIVFLVILGCSKQ